MAVKIMQVKRVLTEAQGDALKTKYLGNDSFDTLITEDTDAYDMAGKMLFKFRKKAIPFEMMRLGYESFKDSIEFTDGRGTAAGGNALRVRKDGTTSNISVAKKVWSGNVGYMDAGAMIHYCRRTAFARDYFEKFQQGIPFVQCVDRLYKELCPIHYASQRAVADGTDINYLIGDTAFTTVTVNKNFQTAVHKDAGDWPKGFGNLCVYREGNYDGSYFCLPEYRVAIDMHTCDILFADVHRWHGNTPFENCSPDYLRIAFVMYYREYMNICKKPSDELFAIKMKETGYLRL